MFRIVLPLLILLFISQLSVSQVLDESFNVKLTRQGDGFSWEGFHVDSEGRLNLQSRDNIVNGTIMNGFFRLNQELEPDFSLKIDPSYFIWGFQTTGKIIVSTSADEPTVLRLNQDGTEDETFNPLQLNNGLKQIHIQKNDHLVIAGFFSEANGSSFNFMIRTDTDGFIDTNFNTGLGVTFPLFFFNILDQSDGKLIISGAGEYNGEPISTIFRLNSDGTIDNTFIESVLSFSVIGVESTRDEKIIVFGFNDFLIGSTNKSPIVRLNSNGSIDESFINPSFDYDLFPSVNSYIGFDGGYYIAGTLNLESGLQAQLLKVNDDGTIDETFTPTSSNLDIRQLYLSDDKTLVVGRPFTEIGGVKLSGMAMFSEDGSIDQSKQVILESVAETEILKLADSDKFLLAGNFDRINSEDVGNVVLIDNNGNIDPNFNQGFFGAEQGRVSAVVALNDGILIAGNFEFLNGVQVNGLAKILTNGAIEESFSHPFTSESFISGLELVADVIVVSGSLNDFNFTTTQIAHLNINGERDYSIDGVLIDETNGEFGTAYNTLFMGAETLVSGFFGSPLRTENT